MSSELSHDLLRTVASVQRYEWGDAKRNSILKKLCDGNGVSYDVNDCRPFAELWIGMHTRGMNSLHESEIPNGVTGLDGAERSTKKRKHSSSKEALDPSRSLRQAVENNVFFQQARSDPGTSERSYELPYLLKVLSVRKPLSVQLHPDAETARTLHATEPDIYADGRAKAEMLIPLSSFALLCGFRSWKDISTLFTDIPELKQLLVALDMSFPSECASGDDAEGSRRDYLRTLLVALQSSLRRSRSLTEAGCKKGAQDLPSHETVLQGLSSEELLSKLYERSSEYLVAQDGDQNEDGRHSQASTVAYGGIDSLPATGADGARSAIMVFRYLYYHFPGDLGCIFAFLMRFWRLSPGDALFLPPNSPHSYLFGDCIECQVSSDNVIRCGLTPKSKDVELFCKLAHLPSGAQDVNDVHTVHRVLLRKGPAADGASKESEGGGGPNGVPLVSAQGSPIDAAKSATKGSESGSAAAAHVYHPSGVEFDVVDVRVEKQETAHVWIGGELPAMGLVFKGDVEVRSDKRTVRLAPGSTFVVAPQRSVAFQGLDSDGCVFIARHHKSSSS
eukprot:GHVU01212508.1.p1 GENE.GHVU01212508.1~~GHVU01212508.1.p1  ORF type:complete len:561 (+),score=57.85 GHVU01212508.1:190-1872(+)